jgi:hypothetical protein
MRASNQWFTFGLLVIAWSLPMLHPTDVAAQAETYNYDEAKVPAYQLPELLVDKAGQKVATAAGWTARRAEIMELYQEQVFGRMPDKIPVTVIGQPSVTERDGYTIEQVTLGFKGHPQGPKLNVLMFLPVRSSLTPIFIGPNFDGNHTVSTDPAIKLAECWLRNDEKKGIVNNRATEKTRGTSASRWDIAGLLKRGYGVVTICYCDIAPDDAQEFRRGVHQLWAPDKTGELGPNECSAIGAWSWGLSRIVDYLETDPRIDQQRIVVHGHSRLGKTALWAGATDPRFKIVISNNSGEGGAAITRRCFGETIKRINTSFPHWFCGNYKQYNNAEDKLPVDSHMLIALAAPRPIYVASATEDKWADPRGEYLGAFHAGPAYQLFNLPVLTEVESPAADTPRQTTIGYHLRTGKHDVTDYDWQQYAGFADNQFQKK